VTEDSDDEDEDEEEVDEDDEAFAQLRKDLKGLYHTSWHSNLARIDYD